jgi:biofilm PGA synthesis N-glycosyltransferase PgaC
MSEAFSIGIVVPLWNEAGNIGGLVELLGATRAVREWGAHATLVNNGSSDRTGALLDELAATRPWMQVVHLAENRNYGGGILEGCGRSAQEYLCYIPGDLQYSGEDTDRVIARLREHHLAGRAARVMVKGKRITRLDGAAQGFVSATYTALARTALSLPVQDINGLPKAFHRSLLGALPDAPMINFMLDAQLMYCARRNDWDIDEIDVTFHRRASGVSSWSGRRVRVYLRSLRDLVSVRAAGSRSIPQ